MRIIEKVEIKHFRSFLGTTQKDKAEIVGCERSKHFFWSK